MNISIFRIVSLFSVLAFLGTSVVAAEEGKLDPKKPVKKAVDEKAAKGTADVKPAGTASNSTTPEVKTRAGAYSCDIHIDNRTNWYINRVAVDNNWWGSVGRFGDAIVKDVGVGPTTVYAEVDFSDGSTSHYGPRVFNCESYTTHRWTLR